MQFLFGPLLGTLSDRVGRKPVILISLIVMVGYYLIMAVAQTVWLLLIGRIVGGITAATHATASAYVADISRLRKRPRVLDLSGRPLVWGLFWGLFWAACWVNLARVPRFMRRRLGRAKRPVLCDLAARKRNG